MAEDMIPVSKIDVDLLKQLIESFKDIKQGKIRRVK
jgi:hypothetical protein